MKQTFKSYYKLSLAQAMFKKMGLKKPNIVLKVFYITLIILAIAASIVL